MSQVIPKGWAKTCLSEVVAVNPKHKDLEDQVAGFVPMALAPTDFNGTLNYEERQWDKIKKGYTHFATGDVIFAKVTPCFENGKAAIVKELPNDIGAGSTEFYVLRPAIKDISVNYIFAVIKSYEFLQTGAENMTGAVGLRRVPKKFVEDFKISLPPLAEQKVISDKLDELLAQVESTKARLDAIPAILKSFRQSVLAAAVSGKLIPSVGYRVTTVGEVAQDIRYGTSKKCNYNGGVTPVIRIPNIGNRKLDVSDLKSANFSDKELDKLALQEDDLLLIRSNGSVELVAKPALVEKQYVGFLFAGYLIRIRCNQEHVLPSFLLNVLCSRVVRDVVEIGARSTSGVNNINSKELASLEFVLPSLKEQNEIVRRVDELFAFADKVEAQVNAAQARVNNLTQSILAKAFKGELTTEWRAANPDLISGENSAEALLKRIKAEREALATKKKSAKKASIRKKA